LRCASHQRGKWQRSEVREKLPSEVLASLIDLAGGSKERPQSKGRLNKLKKEKRRRQGDARPKMGKAFTDTAEKAA